MDEELLDAKIDHAFATGARNGLNVATEPTCFYCQDRPTSPRRKEFEAAIERMRLESARVMKRPSTLSDDASSRLGEFTNVE